VAALAAGQTVADAARLAGVSEATVYRRRADPAFAARVRQVRSDMLSEALGRLAGNLLASVDKLAALIDSADPRVALAACRAILEETVRYREHVDLADRLDDLAKQVSAIKGGRL